MASQKQQKARKTKKVLLLALALLLPTIFLVEFVLLFTPFVSGFAAYPLKTIQCGHPPYIANSFAAGFSYTKPGDGFYRGPDTLTTLKDYYCTEAEVQKAGYKPNIWGEQQCHFTQQGQEMRCLTGKDATDIIVRFIVILIIVSGLLSYAIAFGIVTLRNRA